MPQFSFGQIYSAKSILGVLACAGLFLISSPKAISQTFYGSIVGTVSDSTGAIIPGASVTLTNLGTSDKRTMVSSWVCLGRGWHAKRHAVTNAP